MWQKPLSELLAPAGIKKNKTILPYYRIMISFDAQSSIYIRPKWQLDPDSFKFERRLNTSFLAVVMDIS
jgi:hypothetical protein